MKKKIHPEYHICNVICTSCGYSFKTGSILKEIRVDVCSKCHPFYTGQQHFIHVDGRIDRFNKKHNLKPKDHENNKSSKQG